MFSGTCCILFSSFHLKKPAWLENLSLFRNFDISLDKGQVIHFVDLFLTLCKTSSLLQALSDMPKYKNVVFLKVDVDDAAVRLCLTFNWFTSEPKKLFISKELVNGVPKHFYLPKHCIGTSCFVWRWGMNLFTLWWGAAVPLMLKNNVKYSLRSISPGLWELQFAHVTSKKAKYSVSATACCKQSKPCQNTSLIFNLGT